MALDPKLYITRNEFEVDGSALLHNELAARFATARRITLLSAYYGVRPLQALFEDIPPKTRRGCDLTLVFGHENEQRLLEAVGELRAWRHQLETLRFRSVQIRLVLGGRPFHVKLFHVVNGNSPSWYVGSANASGAIDGDRHEIMVRIYRREGTPPFQEFTDEVIAQSVPVEEVAPAPLAHDLRNFLLAGFIAYSPVHALNLVFEACPLRDVHKTVLERGFRELSAVPHASPRTEGFGLSLLDALRTILGDDAVPRSATVLNGDDAARRLLWRTDTIETSLGHWVPLGLAADLQDRRDRIEGNAREALDQLGQALNRTDPKVLKGQLAAHVAGMQYWFAQQGVPINTRPNYVGAFRAWVETRRAWFTDPKRVAYLAHRLVLEAVPDLWAGGEATARSVERFEESFLEDLLFRLETPGRNKVARRLGTLIGREFRTTRNLRRALEGLLAQGFSQEDWSD